jgi:hypothetical protein
MIGVLILLLGLLCGGAYRLLAGTEHHSYSPGAVAPTQVHLTANRKYELAVPGGVQSLVRIGAEVGTPQCSYTLSGGLVSTQLSVTAEGSDSKATNLVGRFVSPVTGLVHVDCLGWGAVFVDNPDGGAHDLAGWFLLGSVLLLPVGVGMSLSALRSAGSARVGQAG